MLTAARAWLGPPHVRRHGVAGGCDHLHRHLFGEASGARKSLNNQKLVMTRVVQEGAATLPPSPVREEGAEGDAGLWIRYSRKRKKQERGSPVAEGEDGSGTGGTETKAGERDQVGAAMGSPLNQVCSDCGTSRTPLWRKGPAGPKSLCNACGIRYRKARRAGGGFPNAAAPSPAPADGDRQKGDPRASRNIDVSLKLTAAAEEARKQGEDRLRRRQRRREEVLWRLLEESRKFELPCGREAVEAAVLLMAMSSGLFVRSYLTPSPSDGTKPVEAPPLHCL